MGVSSLRYFLVFFALLLSPLGAAYAQVCKEKGGAEGGAANVSCDMRYRDSLITCDMDPETDTLGTRPVCPSKPMPMLSTPRKSYIGSYSNFVYIYPRDPDNKALPYSGWLASGTPGDASRTFQLFGNTAPGSRRLAACTAQIKAPEDPDTPNEWARLIRLQIDNCTNQYILNAALYPFQKEAHENTRALSLEDPDDPLARVSLRTECQPLKTFQESENEYSATNYLRGAWTKTMVNADYRMVTPDHIKCIPCTDPNVPCDREPHLPCAAKGASGVANHGDQGLRLENGLPTPEPFPDVTLSNIGAIEYEEIVDPTHPFSPRWDFLVTDRDYSNPSMRYLGLKDAKQLITLVAIQRAIGIYTSPQNAIFCAGVKSASSESDPKVKADKEVQVDVLEFRRSKFEKALFRRVSFNVLCKKMPAFSPTWSSNYWIIAASACWRFRIIPKPPYVLVRDYKCWDCFEGVNISGTVSYGPVSTTVSTGKPRSPCSTNWVSKDEKIRKYIPGGLVLFKDTPPCGEPMDEVCADLRKPFTPLNKLKMRYHNPNDDEDANEEKVALREGAGEGLSFREYFGNHMPYPRLWDTGTSLHESPVSDTKMQHPLDTTGQYTSIVGVGREAPAAIAAVGADNKKLETYSDQRCKTMGWGEQPIGRWEFSGLEVYWPDPMTSWTELKLYQTNTLRRTGLSCIGRYEKVFKPGSSEQLALMASGSAWKSTQIQKCEYEAGTTRNCESMTLGKYTDEGSPENTETTVYITQPKDNLWPNAWRGYMADEGDDRFPNFGGGNPEIIENLDEAEPGDILLMPTGLKKGDRYPGLAKVALVIETRLPTNSDCQSDNRAGCYIRVLEGDHGKWPDICGTTDTWGEMKDRKFWRPAMPGGESSLPEQVRDECVRIGSICDCSETRLGNCELNAWTSGDVKLYRIRNDRREGCDKASARECGDE
jgi:hypothetical protein